MRVQRSECMVAHGHASHQAFGDDPTDAALQQVRTEISDRKGTTPTATPPKQELRGCPLISLSVASIDRELAGNAVCTEAGRTVMSSAI